MKNADADTLKYLLIIEPEPAERDQLRALLARVERGGVKLRWAGPMAQDIQKTHPDLVFTDPATGHLRVKFHLMPRHCWPRVIAVEEI